MSKRLGFWIVAMTSLGLSSGASAAIISFENPAGPGHFDWFGGVVGNTRYLDLELAASSQPNIAGSSSSYGQLFDSANNRSRHSGNVRGRATASVNGLEIGFAAGTIFDSSGTYAGSPYILNPALGGSMIPEGTETFIAVRFNPNGAPATACSVSDPLNPCHYGWIKVVRTGFDLDALAWAYEDVPATPIIAGAVPEPASLSLLLIGGVALLRRRRNRA